MFNNIISVENLLEAWKEFLKGKRGKKDVQDFQYRLSDNILDLHTELKNKTYAHGGYYAFNISDPKPRNIHKATVRDRLLHHAIYRQLYPFFDTIFISDSYSCRKFRGTHRALKKFREYSYIASKNNTKTLWILKCDIRKFFASIEAGLLQVDYFFCPLSSSRVAEGSKILFEKVSVPKGDMLYDPKRVKQDRSDKASFVICMCFVAIKKVVRKDPDFMPFLLSEYANMKKDLFPELPVVEGDNSFETIKKLLQGLESIATPEQKCAIEGIRRFTGEVELK